MHVWVLTGDREGWRPEPGKVWEFPKIRDCMIIKEEVLLSPTLPEQRLVIGDWKRVWSDHSRAPVLQSVLI